MAMPKQEFSPKSVSQAVLRDTLSRPYVLYPAAAGILGGLAAAVLGPSLVFVLPAAIGAAVGLGAFGVQFGLRREHLANEYLRKLHAAMAGRVERLVEELHGDFDTLGHRAGLDQLEHLQRSFAACEELLKRKLRPSEMTFNRYLGMTEQVFLAGLDNLRQIRDALQGLASIDARGASRRLEELDRAARLSEPQRRERIALQERVALVERQQGKIEIWLAENEQALTQMDHVMAAIADMETDGDQAKMDMGPAMQELQSLIERAHQYIRADSDEASRDLRAEPETSKTLAPPPKRGS